MSAHLKPSDRVELSIGTLSSATGVPVDTLRTWERRYGFPVPTARTEGSHRRYSAETVAIVQLVVRALELGHRPSAIVGRAPRELERLIGQPHRGPRHPIDAAAPSARIVQQWLRLTHELEGDALSAAFHRCLAEMPAIEFLERCMGPYLFALGECWAHGELRVSQEHLASETAREFLSAQWLRLTERARDPARASVVFATPPGEQHVLGLHMAAWAVARAGARVVFLGADTPMAEVAFAAQHHAAEGIALSVALGYTGDLRRHVAELLARLPRRVSVALGGAGSWNVGAPVRHMNGFLDLLNWAEWLPERG